jgi:hypothetical protein
LASNINAITPETIGVAPLVSPKDEKEEKILVEDLREALPLYSDLALNKMLSPHSDVSVFLPSIPTEFTDMV